MSRNISVLQVNEGDGVHGLSCLPKEMVRNVDGVGNLRIYRCGRVAIRRLPGSVQAAEDFDGYSSLFYAKRDGP